MHNTVYSCGHYILRYTYIIYGFRLRGKLNKYNNYIYKQVKYINCSHYSQMSADWANSPRAGPFSPYVGPFSPHTMTFNGMSKH